LVLISITTLHFSNSNCWDAAFASLWWSLSSAVLHWVGFVLGATRGIVTAGFSGAAGLTSRTRFTFLFGSSFILLFLFLALYLGFGFGLFDILINFVYHESVPLLGFVDNVSSETFKVGNGILNHFNCLFVIARDITWVTAGWAALGGVTGLWLILFQFGFVSWGLKSLSVFPHYPIITLVHGNGELEETKFFSVKLAKPPVSEPFTPFACAQPYSCKVTGVADVLSHGYSGIQVDDCVPPATRHKHGLSRILNAFYHLRQSPIWVQVFSLFQSWKNEIKIVDGFIVFSFGHQVLASDEPFVDFRGRWYQNPSFVALNRSVPRARSQWVLMDFRTRSLWPNQKPSMRWLILLWQEIVKIVTEVLGLCVVLLHHVRFRVLFQTALK
jgi:hypothetical protein